MDRNRTLRMLPIVAIFIMSTALVPGCRRAPETPPEEAPAAESSSAAQIELDTLDLPLENPRIRIALSKTPPGLVATYNDEAAIEITDERRPVLRFTFDADLPGAPSRSPKNVADFERFIGKHHDGSFTDSGEIETALGVSTWASGTYFEEDQSFADVRVFAPHPSGNGTLILLAVIPANQATVEEQLSTMKAILDHVL